MSRIKVTEYSSPQGWADSSRRKELAQQYCEKLESGCVLYFDSTPFIFPQADREFLLSQRQKSSKGYRHISYRPKEDSLRGAADRSPENSRRLQEIMRKYSQHVTDFLGRFLAPYAGKWSIESASFRPKEEENRYSSQYRRQELAHLDAYLTRPTNGSRILRVFTNINPTASRVWEVTDPFEVIAKKYAHQAGLRQAARHANGKTRAILRGLAPVLRTVGMRHAGHSPYDRFMVRFQDFLKEDADYQYRHPKSRLEFLPGSTWLVYTDTVPHTVISGKYALEQTFIMPMSAMVSPQNAPLRVLETMCGASLANA